MNRNVIVMIIISLVLLAGIGFIALLSRVDFQSNTANSINPKAIHTFEEVERNNSLASCWMIIESKVYDLTNYINIHPGGREIVEGCGKDATSLFKTKGGEFGDGHSNRAISMLTPYFKGNLK